MPQAPEPQPLRRYFPFAALVLCLLAIAGVTAGVAFAGASTGAVQQAVTANAPGAPAVTSTPTPCVPSWTVVSSPNSDIYNNTLYGVAVAGPGDVWAVGYSSTSGNFHLTLIERWDGTSWSIVPSPSPSSTDNILYSVAVVSANDVWAVGQYNTNTAEQTLVEHWDGTSWSVVASPNVGPNGNYLYGVAAVSANDIWAVGWYSIITASQTLIEHWDGSIWSVVSSPNLGSNRLSGVAAAGPSDVWAVGFYNTGGVDQTLVERWDGTSWSMVSSPNSGAGNNDLAGVAVASSNDVWAVGHYNNGSVDQTLTERWDGSTWSIVASPNSGSGSNDLAGVAAVSSNDVWSVGWYVSGSTSRTLTEHWDGSTWTIVASPNSGTGSNYLSGTAVASSSDVWTVGLYIAGTTYKTLTERYTNTCPTSSPTTTALASTPTRTPTSTPTAPAATATPTAASTFTATPTCVSGWTVVSSPDPGDTGFLYGVSALAANNLWAVGDFTPINMRQTLVERWDGTTWSVVPSPNQDSAENRLTGVAAVSANDVWAVGLYFTPTKTLPQAPSSAQTALIEHWDGSAWAIFPNPGVGSSDSELVGITAISANDVWAVGDHTDVNGPNQTLIEHFDGTSWSVVPSANRPSSMHYLYGVAAASANDVWAVGEYVLNDYTEKGTLIEHWDGTAWSIVPSPSQPSSFNHLYAVSVVSANDVWAVGYYGGQSGTLQQTLIEQWDGSSWSIVSSPNEGSSSNYLTGVAAISANDVWAVGYYEGSTNQPLEEHWDGTAWSVYGPPSGMSYSDSWAVAAISSGDVWAVGQYQHDNQASLTEHYTTCNLTPTPTALLTPATSTATPTPSPTHTLPPSLTPTPTLTSTAPVVTSTATTVPTGMPTYAATGTTTTTPTGTVSSEATATPTSPEVTTTPTTCTLSFTDVPPGSTFYPYIHCLACLGIINGYPDGSFKPNNNVTRGQLSKIVANSAGFSDPQPNQMFQDVPLGSTFQVYIGRLASREYINGYPCGGPGEPCLPPNNLPYFRPNNNATRGQISKIDANAAGFNDPPTGQQFEDVAVGSAFYTYTYRLVSRSVMSGYPCGGAGEPCVPPANLPYFRPGNNATRGQTSKIVGNTFFPGCER